MMIVEIVSFLINKFGCLVEVIQLIDGKLSIEEHAIAKCILKANFYLMTILKLMLIFNSHVRFLFYHTKIIL